MDDNIANQEMNRILEKAVAAEASDVHIFAGKVPYFRIHGNIQDSGCKTYTAKELDEMLLSMLTPDQKEKFDKELELDFSYRCMATHQFRVNFHKGERQMGAVIRITATKMGNIDDLGLPAALKELARKQTGLVILSGTAGSGKSTSLTYMVDLINRERKSKIITIEDPIEYHHEPIKSIILQREVGQDTNSFGNALKYALRQDPDVVVIGEMRDLESISMALTTAETGHLVFTTVHAPNSVETISRIVDVFPSGMRDQIYTQLASNLLGICSQALLPRKEGNGRILATEVLLATTAIRNLIRRGALMEIRAQLEGDEADLGMHSLETCMVDLYRQGKISKDVVAQHASNYSDLDLEGTKQKYLKNVKIEKVSREEVVEEVYVYEGKRVLIIGADEKINVDMAKAMRADGFQSIASQVEEREGLERFLAYKPDIVLVYLGLPLLGFDVVRNVKKLDKNNTRVIVITGNLKPMDLEEAKEAGADDFVIRTSDYKLLLNSMKCKK